MAEKYIFEWDEEKALLNFLKHGVRFEEALIVFYDDDSLTAFDFKHSEQEERYQILGMTGDKRLLTVVHTYRKEKIRLISARPANKRQRKQYEETKNHQEKNNRQ